MAILFSDQSYRSDKIFASLREAMPDIDLRQYPDIGNPDEIDYAIIWYPAPASLQNLPNLKGIFTTSAGVDGIIQDDTLPADVPIIRNVDPALARGVAEYVTYQALRFYRHHHTFDRQQHSITWQQIRQPDPQDCTIGIMGLGEIGKKCAEYLAPFGFPIRSWSQSKKDVPFVTSFAGDKSFHDFLSGTNILINTLPLTSKTTEILNSDTFAHLPDGAFLINVGRGKHLVDADLIQALESKKIAAAALDVFTVEPLPQDHPFWMHPQITMTPHIASITRINVAVQNILQHISDFENGIPFQNTVNKQKEY